MNIYESIKAAISVKQSAEHYGLKVSRNGMACCPFHNDRHPSLKLNEEYFFCFGCGAKGDVIDFVARLFDLSSYEAAQRLAADFGISTEPGQPVAVPHKLKHPYQTVLGENGSTLSGGERQRISIARALLKNAPIILLDEATASLDPENEVLVQKAIAKLVEGKTVIMIAHRLRTVVDADQILVLDNGRLAEYGTHDELMRKNGLYHKLFHIQQESLGWAV